jgi:DNA-binding transcriptional regulator YiaG
MNRRIRSKKTQSRDGAPTPKSLAKRLYQWRKKKNFSQAQAALKLRVSKRTLQEWEQGRAQPRHLALAAMNRLIKS